MTSSQLSLRLAAPTVLLYAAGYPIGAAALHVMSPMLVIVIRFAVSGALLWLLVLIRRVPMPSRRQAAHAMIVGLMTQAVQFIGLYWGLSHGVPAGLAALIVALNPVATAAIMSLLGHRESRSGMAALVLATASVILACAPSLATNHHVGVGLVTVVIAMLGLSIGGIHQGRKCRGMDPMLITVLGLTASTPIAVAAAVVSPAHVTDWPRALVFLAVMIVFSSIGATTLYAACIARSGPRASSIMFAVIPAVAGVMSWIALGEALSPLAVAGLVLGALACVVQSRARRTVDSDPTAADGRIDVHPDRPTNRVGRTTHRGADRRRLPFRGHHPARSW